MVSATLMSYFFFLGGGHLLFPKFFGLYGRGKILSETRSKTVELRKQSGPCSPGLLWDINIINIKPGINLLSEIVDGEV